MTRLTTTDPQLARALAAITLPSFDELVALTRGSTKPDAVAPITAQQRAAIQHRNWQQIFLQGPV